MNFEYLATVKKESSIDIENIGTCVIDAYNDLAFNWILIIKTTDGITEVIEYGPIIADLEYLPANVSYTYSRFDFNEMKISKIISKFLNGYNNITQAFEITFEESKSKIKNLVEYVNGSK